VNDRDDAHPPIPRPTVFVIRTATRLTLLALFAFAGLLVTSGVASAKPPCWQVLVNDWYDGRIDRVYPVKCYRDALKHLPTDIEQYSSARDDINRALAALVASNRKPPKPPRPAVQKSSKSKQAAEKKTKQRAETKPAAKQPAAKKSTVEKRPVVPEQPPAAKNPPVAKKPVVATQPEPTVATRPTATAPERPISKTPDTSRPKADSPARGVSPPPDPPASPSPPNQQGRRGTDGPLPSAIEAIGPDDPDSLPIPLLVLGSLAILLLLLGSAGFIARRLQARRAQVQPQTQTPSQPIRKG
jgi:hypothetical protein